jgi:hypothetical protein
VGVAVLGRPARAGVALSLGVCAALALLAMIALGCFSPRQPECAFSCVSDGLCPAAYHCGDDGLCHRDDGQGVCTLPPQRDGEAIADGQEGGSDAGNDAP